MKKILGVILITFLISCNSNSKTEKELLQKELELTKKEQNSDNKDVEITKSHEVEKPEEITNPKVKAEIKTEPIKKLADYTFDNFHISENRIGIFSKGMSISDVYNIIPKEQIKKKVGYGEFADDTYDDYEIYDSNGKKILILTPKQNGNTNSKIHRVLILDKRFKTTENIGLNSTYGDLAKYYSTNEISTDIEGVVINVNHINARFTIKKTELQDGWWNGNEIDKSKIPNTAKFDGISIWWK